MAKLISKKACIVEVGGVRVLAGENDLTDEQLKAVAGSDAGAYLIENKDFVVEKKAPSTPKSKGEDK